MGPQVGGSGLNEVIPLARAPRVNWSGASQCSTRAGHLPCQGGGAAKIWSARKRRLCEPGILRPAGIRLAYERLPDS